MILSAPLAPSPSRRRNAFWVVAFAATLALGLGLHGPIAQWPGYHLFADTRGWLGIPNTENVLSNLPFALIGLWGWQVHSGSSSPRRTAWRGFSMALIATAFGSALYHSAPSNGSLVFDRLPIAWACAFLTCALLAERFHACCANLWTLAAAALLASASVAWWWLGEQHAGGDLRAYLFVQFLPMLLVPVILGLKVPGVDAYALPGRDWWTVLGLYAAAKLMELADRGVLDLLGFTSGHTLKHLLAGAAALWLLKAAARTSAPLNSGSRR